MSLNIGVEAGLPTNGAKFYSNFGSGITLGLEYPLKEHIVLTLSAGYYTIYGKTYNYIVYRARDTVSVTSFNTGIIPIKVGLKAFTGKGLYASFDYGGGLETSTEDQYRYNMFKMVLSPGAGYSIKGFDAGLRYEYFFSGGPAYGIMAIRFAYGFKL